MLPPPFLIADHPALDFLNSRASPSGTTLDWISDGKSFLAWQHAAGLGPPPAEFEREQLTSELDRIAQDARNLREWLRHYVDRRLANPNQTAAKGDLTLLNRLLAEDNAFRQLAPASDTGVVIWSNWQRQTLRTRLLQPLAHAIGDLLVEADFSRIRACSGTGCSLYFLDRTKAGARRWCSMSVCGNRTKASLHRKRQKPTN